MAWFKCGGGGIPAALKSLMNSVFNKKFGTEKIYAPEIWPDTVNLMGPLEEKTVSGSVVAFSDGADTVPLKKCEITLPASLDGYSSVNVVQSGKNILPNTAQTATENGVTFTVNSDGSVSLSGTCNADTNFYIYSGFTFPKLGQYFFSGCPSGGSTSTYRVFLTNYGADVGSGYLLNVSNLSTTTSIRINIKSGVVTDGLVFKPQIEAGSTATTYEAYTAPTTHTATLGRTIYGGSVDVVNGTGTDENGNDFSFAPVPVNSLLDDNTLWSNAGDLEVVYRSTGTETIIQPTLVTKAITENGTYTAAADNADGYSSVTVNVPTGATNIETVLGDDPLIEITGVSGTDVTRTMWTRTAAQAETVVFHPNTQVKTNTGSNDGYFKVLKNSEVIVSTYANTSTTTALVIPDIELEAGDVLTIVGGFDNSHTSCWFDLYSTITILSSGSAPVLGLGLGNPGPVSEPEEEEPDAAPEEIQEETPEEVEQNESNE